MAGTAKKGRETLTYAAARVKGEAGGWARLRIILLLACILGLDTADKGAISAVAGSLKDAFHIGNFLIGILISAVSFVGAIGTLPAGVFIDRLRRKRILMYAVFVWAAAMVVSGMATSYTFLLITRLFLGFVTATATPAVASLTGDFFPARERGHIYGLILAGELVGAGLGFILAGTISSWLSWRWAFFALSVPSAALALVIWRYLPEPARGGQSRLQPGQEEIRSEEDVRKGKKKSASGDEQTQGKNAGSDIARKQMKKAHIEPVKALILDKDPKDKRFWWAVRYVLSIRTNLLLIIASALGYYFFSGVRAFGMIYVTQHYGISRSTASSLVLVLGISAVIGVISGGRLADRMLRKGAINARVVVPGAGLILSVLFIAPALWVTSVYWAMALLIMGVFALAAANSPLDAARLDIMHARLWGRAESIRTTLRMILEGAAPTLFGFISQYLFGGGENGLQWTFLVMLLPVIVASSLAIPARRSYPHDVATVNASVEKQQANANASSRSDHA